MELVRMEGIVKRFGSITADDHVDFDLMSGEIHALLGENGAGKTTLMRILAGEISPDEGKILIRGREVGMLNPKKAMDLGVGIVHQHFMLVEGFTVAENLILALEESLVGSLREVSSRIVEVSRAYGMNLNPNAVVADLSMGERQKVELLKVLCRDSEILILDEPTTVLTPDERRNLFSTLLRMKERGKGVVLITHRLEEIFQVADRVTVLRRGRVVDTRFVDEVSPSELAVMMIGRDLPRVVRPDPPSSNGVVLKVENLSSGRLRNVSLEVRRGEILGLAGISGNGQKELVESIVGLRKVSKGKIYLEGVDVTNMTPRRLYDMGVAYIPEDRVGEGIVPDMSIAENLALKFYRRMGSLLLDRRGIVEMASRLMESFDIKPKSPLLPAGNLSGGNVQRMVCARELSTEPKLLIAHNPTRGLDIAATSQVREMIVEQSKKGTAIFFVSEDLDELMNLSHRLAVMSSGEIVGVLNPREYDPERIGKMMAS